MDDNYVLTIMDGVTRHWRKSSMVRDGTRIKSAMYVEAQISSGDFFVTVASQLDEICRETDDYSVKLCLEDIVSDLIYLQDNYTIVKNKQTE